METRDIEVESGPLFWCDLSRVKVAVFVQADGGGVLQAALAG
jgi:hypothetical protein